jgi:hypothetical protein
MYGILYYVWNSNITINPDAYSTTLPPVAGLESKEEQNANSPYLDWKGSGSHTIQCWILVGDDHHHLLSTCAYREKCFRYLNR